MVKVNSEVMTSSSRFCASSSSSLSSFDTLSPSFASFAASTPVSSAGSSAVIPLPPVLRHPRPSRVPGDDPDEPPDKEVPVRAAVELGDALEREDPRRDAENVHDVRHRRRTFHAV